MSNIKKIAICILAISLVILAITTNVFATEDLFSSLSGNNSNNVKIDNIATKDNNTSNNISNNTNKNANTNASNAQSHADAGVDYSIVFIIAVCGISTIYAYKKIRNYNI